MYICVHIPIILRVSTLIYPLSTTKPPSRSSTKTPSKNTPRSSKSSGSIPITVSFDEAGDVGCVCVCHGIYIYRIYLRY